MSQPAGIQPTSPRSPRPALPNEDAPPTPGAFPGTAGAGTTRPPGTLDPATAMALMAARDQQPPPRSSISSMLFLTTFFFFMSGGNGPPQRVVIAPNGEIVQRQFEVDVARRLVNEYQGWMNGTGNWTEPHAPDLLPSAIVPRKYQHGYAYGHGHHNYFTNITGFYRQSSVHALDLLAPDPNASADTYFAGVDVRSLNTTMWNETLAVAQRGEFSWSNVSSWEMNIKERAIALDADGQVVIDDAESWTWVKGGLSIGTAQGDNVDYDFFGLHYVPNGTYELFAKPEGIRIDIRNIPTLFSGHRNVTSHIILEELKKELRVQENNILLNDAKQDELTRTTCSLLMHIAVPPLPAGVNPTDLALYEAELANPTGILASLPRPPHYWDDVGLGIVAVADGCGWAYGVDNGRGIRIDDFWRKSINYAAFATISQLSVLFLLVRQMESTRTPSTLARVSLWSIVLMFVSDSWTFSAHVVIGIMSDNKTSLPMLIPGFCCLCTAIVFGPRYAVLLHRIQAPERAASVPARRPTPVTTIPATNSDGTETIEGTAATSDTQVDVPQPSVTDRIAELLGEYPALKWLAGATTVFLMFQIALLPTVVPFFLFAMYSFWVPQIYRNARRGSGQTFDNWFVLGTSAARLALPLYAFACPDNVFFIENSYWVFWLVAWQATQIVVLYAQSRFGPAFFLPKSFAPTEGYNYHPLLPAPDAENAGSGFGEGETTCSICMEEVDTHPAGPSVEPSALLGLNARRAYAVAPCHHLFHTKCLAQWLAIKTICPLCKRSLPPL